MSPWEKREGLPQSAADQTTEHKTTAATEIPYKCTNVETEISCLELAKVIDFARQIQRLELGVHEPVLQEYPFPYFIEPQEGLKHLGVGMHRSTARVSIWETKYAIRMQSEERVRAQAFRKAVHEHHLGQAAVVDVAHRLSPFVVRVSGDSDLC